MDVCLLLKWTNSSFFSKKKLKFAAENLYDVADFGILGQYSVGFPLRDFLNGGSTVLKKPSPIKFRHFSDSKCKFQRSRVNFLHALNKAWEFRSWTCIVWRYLSQSYIN